MQIEKRQALTRQIWGHRRIRDEKQGDSKETGYQLKGDLSHMYRFLSRQLVGILELVNIFFLKRSLYLGWDYLMFESLKIGIVLWLNHIFGSSAMICFCFMHSCTYCVF